MSSFMALVISFCRLAGRSMRRKRLWLDRSSCLRAESESFEIAVGVSGCAKPCGVSKPSLGSASVPDHGARLRLLTLVTCVVMRFAWRCWTFVTLRLFGLAAAPVALICFGLFTRDGLYVLLGYLMILDPRR